MRGKRPDPVPVPDKRGSSLTNEGLMGLLVRSVREYAIFLLDPNGYVLTWNPGAERIKGYREAEIVGRHFSTFYPPEAIRAGQCERLIESARRDGTVEDEGFRVRKDGTEFWASVIITAVHDDAGALIGFAKVTRDLTERRQAEEALRQSEERFRLLVTSVEDYAIFILDPRGHVRTWNAGAQCIKGYKADEIIGRHFSEFYPPEEVRAGKCERQLEAALRDGHHEDEGYRLRKDGRRFWASVVIYPVRNQAGEHIGFAKVTRDLTERRRAEEERAQLSQARETNRVKDELLAIISHELRTPLNAILGWSQVLLGQAQTPTSSKGLATIERNARSQSRLIDDMLDMSCITTGTLGLKVAPVSLTTVVKDAIETARAAAELKGVEFTLLEYDNDLAMCGDATRLRQVVLNLASNAVKFTDVGGRVSFSLSRKVGEGVLTVSDTGCGIEPDILPFIFDRFRQADSSTTRRFGGLGLGLAIARHIVDLHHGKISARSEGLGRGSTFTMTLPLLTEEPRRAPSHS